jgi:perosamine synthetase
MMHSVSLSSPDISSEERRWVLHVLSGRTLSLGPMLPAFEEALSRVAGTRYAIAVNSGTSALHLCVKAAGIGEGDEVITTPFSFVASANCLLYERAVPEFADIDLNTYNLDPAIAATKITDRTRAILPVHVFGCPCDMDAIGRLAARNELTVIEDSCEALGASFHGRPAGSLGHSGAFAFYPNKQITTGEGGAVVTNDPQTARLCRSWRNQGRGEGGAWLQHERLGYNYRIADINCALGLAQLSRLPEILTKRAKVAAMYDEMLADMGDVILPPRPSGDSAMSWFVYVVRLADDFSQPDRDRILMLLKEGGIGCSNYFAPIHLQPHFREMFGYRPGDFPVTEHVAQRTIALPFHNHLKQSEVELVVQVLSRAIETVSHRSKVFFSTVS